MKLSVSCPSCGKEFRNIKPEMAGKKARCGCGAIVRLGEKPVRQREPKNQPVGLLDVDLLGDEMLGDQMLGGDLLDNAPNPPRRHNPPTSPVPAALPSSKAAKRPTAKQHPAVKRRKPSRPPPRLSETKTSQGRVKRGLKTTADSVELDPPGLPTPSPAESRTSKQGSSGQSKSDRKRVPQVPLTVDVKDSRNRPNAKPMFEQTYGDLDDILAGAGDASPLVARPLVPAKSEVATEPEVERKRTASTMGFLAALASATLAFWFGLFVAGSRFQIVEWFLLDNFSLHLQSVYSAVFGESDVPGGFQAMFLVLGWLLWGLAVAMILIAIGQFINAFIKLLADRQTFGWSDGLAAAAGVAGLFLMLAIVFGQLSFAKTEHQRLDVYEQPVVAEGEHLDNVTRLRTVIDDRNRSFTTSMLVASTIPTAIFVLSMVRLFTKSSIDE